jgi:hypothetical protein
MNNDSIHNLFIIEPTAKTPSLSINRELKKMEIKGRSIPEDPRLFYEPIYEQIKLANFSELTIEVNLEYFNSSSSRAIFDLFKWSNEEISNVTINWYCDEEDEDMIEWVKEISELININLIIEENI